MWLELGAANLAFCQAIRDDAPFSEQGLSVRHRHDIAPTFRTGQGLKEVLVSLKCRSENVRVPFQGLTNGFLLHGFEDHRTLTVVLAGR